MASFGSIGGYMGLLLLMAALCHLAPGASAQSPLPSPANSTPSPLLPPGLAECPPILPELRECATQAIGQPGTVSATCCSATTRLLHLSLTTADRRSTCNCIKGLLATLATQLPSAAVPMLTFPLSVAIDCNRLL